jgi:hypothetical protein
MANTGPALVGVPPFYPSFRGVAERFAGSRSPPLIP